MYDGKKEVIDFRLAASKSAAEWENFLADLYRRGLTGEGLDMICVDGGSGLLTALPNSLHGIPVQRCWAHKIRKVLNKVRKADQPKVKRALHKVMNATNPAAARSAARRFADRRGCRQRGDHRLDGAARLPHVVLRPGHAAAPPRTVTSSRWYCAKRSDLRSSAPRRESPPH